MERHRRSVTALANVALLALAYSGAFLLRFDFSIPEGPRRLYLATLPAAIVLQYAALSAFKLTRGWWRYVSISDFLDSLRAGTLGGLGLIAYVYLVHRNEGYPRSVFLLNFILMVGLSIGGRLAVRLWRQLPAPAEAGRRLLVIGAGDTAEGLLREIRQGRRLRYRPVAILDDDPRKLGMYLNGVPVLGPVSKLAEVVSKQAVEEIIIATPSASGGQMRDMIGACRETRLPFKVMPATWEVLSRRGVGAPRGVEINDLLRRPPVELDKVGIGRFLTGKRILVTGAAGSIGAEIARQVLAFRPAKLICLDHDENALFFLERSLAAVTDGVPVHHRLGDITDEVSMDAVFIEHRPEVVFHAAAHKHVGMLEANPVEGVRNNVFGTVTVATLAGRHGADAFVLISTDKAVNPSSLMGATKRAAELLIQTLPFETRYTAVRFGNVLGSQGSVVPILKEQIANGGPVTITHPEMRRFFMTIPEAVELVIQAGAMGRESEIFMLDMGEPVRIVDLANDLIQLSGLRPGVDIEIQFTGIRPGEKLAEELYVGSEQADATTHPKIVVARRGQCDRAAFSAHLERLRAAVDRHDASEARALLEVMVPEFKPSSREAPSLGRLISFPRAGRA
jgi:FlaA1/EpsC-like NDP-sugar epimerase